MVQRVTTLLLKKNQILISILITNAMHQSKVKHHVVKSVEPKSLKVECDLEEELQMESSVFIGQREGDVTTELLEKRKSSESGSATLHHRYDEKKL